MEIVQDFSRASIALELIRHKALCDISRGYNPTLGIEDINEVMTVAGAPLIVPDEIKAREVKIIKADKEDE